MKLTIEGRPGAPLVQAYSSAGIRIDNRLYPDSVLVTATAIVEPWPPRAIDELTADDLQKAVDGRPEVLLIGTGRSQRFPSRDVLAALHQLRIGFEVMDTGAACRTYNVLVAEGRIVAAGLIVEQ